MVVRLMRIDFAASKVKKIVMKNLSRNQDKEPTWRLKSKNCIMQ